MNFNKIVENIQQMKGNYFRRTGEIYILPTNIEKIPILFDNCDDFQSILITPFLLTSAKDSFYELHDYEFEIEVRDVALSHYIEHSMGNVLPQEIVEHIKPKAIVSIADKTFIKNSLYSYFKAMKNMTFKDDKRSINTLVDSSLYFQIY